MAIFRLQATLLLLSFFMISSQSFIGVYLSLDIIRKPDPYELTKFLNTTYIKNVRISSLDPDYIMPMGDIDISVIVSTDNLDIPQMAINEFQCMPFIKDIKRYNLGNQIHTYIIGSNAFEGRYSDLDTNELVKAMNNMQSVIDKAGLHGKVKISAIVSTNTLTRSDIPSKAGFRKEHLYVIKDLLQFLRENGSPFMMSTFPYYDYVTKPTPRILKLCLFQPNSGLVDPGTGLNYTNMFAIKVDSMRNALNHMGYGDLEIVVAETGWPSDEDENEIGGSLKNARLYNANLIHFLRSKVGTPMMPKKSINTYISMLLDADEDHYARVRPRSNRSLGIIHHDLTWKYNIYLGRKR